MKEFIKLIRMRIDKGYIERLLIVAITIFISLKILWMILK
jgi:hypothetical protein